MAKKKVTYSVEGNILVMFDIITNQEAINKSKWIENQMAKFIEEKAEKENKEVL